MSTEQNEKKDASLGDAYLGDGVYASNDGFQIWLAVNHHENVVVALDEQVMNNLIAYAKQFFNRSE